MEDSRNVNADIRAFIDKIGKRLGSSSVEPGLVNEGRVISVGDGIIVASGLSQAGYGEIVEIGETGRGLVFNLDETTVSVILLGETRDVTQGTKVRSTGRILGIKASYSLLGRIVDPLREPLDDKPLSEEGEFYPLERLAPGVIEREPVDTPLKTGIKVIDSMIPIGRGQRELIIGDRNTGKTALAIDTIINQKKLDLSLRQVICVYCAIGKKRSSVAQTVAVLAEQGALAYTVVVSSTASDSAALQYLAPFTATAIAEYFMDKGEDVLLVYDDLSRHAWVYRQISLLLKRPAGREAYPGDIFYLHSRLLERSARKSREKGGGSITSLPIIETQSDDISSYIPTNVISITDGQIYLRTDIFNAGTRPAIDVGLSVSRVGGAAQTKAMKQVTGPLRLDIAQYRSLAAFAQFGSDLDENTQKLIDRGKRVAEILKQPQYAPYDEAAEIVCIFAATRGLFDDLPLDSIGAFERKVYDFIRMKNPDLMALVSGGKKIEQESLDLLRDEIVSCKAVVRDPRQGDKA